MNKSNLIIIAEDDDEIAAILTGYLHRAGMKTCRAEDGEQAINLTRLHKPTSCYWISIYPFMMAGTC